jgi:hypothetical protein
VPASCTCVLFSKVKCPFLEFVVHYTSIFELQNSVRTFSSAKSTQTSMLYIPKKPILGMWLGWNKNTMWSLVCCITEAWRPSHWPDQGEDCVHAFGASSRRSGWSMYSFVKMSAPFVLPGRHTTSYWPWPHPFAYPILMHIHGFGPFLFAGAFGRLMAINSPVTKTVGNCRWPTSSRAFELGNHPCYCRILHPL